MQVVSPKENTTNLKVEFDKLWGLAAMRCRATTQKYNANYSKEAMAKVAT